MLFIPLFIPRSLSFFLHYGCQRRSGVITTCLWPTLACSPVRRGGWQGVAEEATKREARHRNKTHEEAKWLKYWGKKHKRWQEAMIQQRTTEEWVTGWGRGGQARSEERGRAGWQGEKGRVSFRQKEVGDDPVKHMVSEQHLCVHPRTCLSSMGVQAVDGHSPNGIIILDAKFKIHATGLDCRLLGI